MAEPRYATVARSSVTEVNQVLRNTYLLLALTIAFAKANDSGDRLSKYIEIPSTRKFARLKYRLSFEV